MRSNKVGGLLGVTALLLALTVPGPAGARSPGDGAGRDTAATREHGPAIATFEGRRIDLSKDWGEAQACLVWRQGGVLECFRTSEALDARSQELAPRRATVPSSRPSPTSPSTSESFATASYSCSSSLKLFDYTWYGGRQLSFWDRGYWQNLWDYGFDERTSSYVVGGCYVHLALHAYGQGIWYPGPTYPYAGELAMYWNWQNAVSSIYIE